MISSIGQFLNGMGVQSRFFDLGRHIKEISDTTFQRFEDQAIAYPNPYLQHAWLGLLFWDIDTPEVPLLWFLKFPLDEQGKLIASERDRFLKQLLTAVGTNIDALKNNKTKENDQPMDRLGAVLEGNPFVFQPTPERQAAMHARIRSLLQHPPSDFYPAACTYLNSDLSRWQDLGVQGLADIAVRWPHHQSELISAIINMPSRPLISLCQCLENEAINGVLGKALQQRLLHSIEKISADTGRTAAGDSLMASLIRGLSQCTALELRQRTLLSALQSPAIEAIEVLAAIATRCGQDLSNPALCLPFLEALCLQGQDTFNRIMTDLLFLPALRPHILAVFRQEQRSPTLITAIGGLLNSNHKPDTLH